VAGAGKQRGGSSRGTGGSVGESAEAKLLRSLEDEIRYGKKETGIVIMPDGRVVRVKGKQHSVSFPTDFLRTVRGGTLTHNHPAVADGRSQAAKRAQLARAGRLTSGFSGADLSIAERFGLREMRAVGETRNYSYRPGGGRAGAASAYKLYNRLNTAQAKAMYQQQKMKWARRLQAAERAGDTAKVDRIAKGWGKAKQAINAGFTYIVVNQNMRSLRQAGFDITARRGRPLVTVKR
jgi:hypothetical protein